MAHALSLTRTAERCSLLDDDDGIVRRTHSPGLLVAEPAVEVTMAVGIQRNMGLLVLAIWLILYGLSGMVALGLPAPLMGILALIAGVLILAGR